MKGLIASDIDGTLTDGIHEISPHVVQYFEWLHKQGWMILFVTGRTFQFGYSILHRFTFPYYFAVQNGAMLIKMPEKKMVHKQNLRQDILTSLDNTLNKYKIDYAIYTGFENQDIVYFRPKNYTEPQLNYLKERAIAFKENWQPIESYHSLKLLDFPSIKFIGEKPTIEQVAEDVQKNLSVYIPVIKDPFSPLKFVAQGTNPKANKGDIVQYVHDKHLKSLPIIVAGDDYNDEPMFNVATTKVVMATAPENLKKNADIIAPSAKDNGIIEGLNQAIRR